MADAGELKARATLDNLEFLKSLKEMTTQVTEQSKSTSDAMESIADSIDKVTSAVKTVAALGGMSAFAKEALDAAAATDKLHAAFKTLNGPTAETEKIFEDMSGLEMKSMFDFEDTLGPAAKQMMMLGVSADQTSKTMQGVVDAAAGLKEGPEWIQGVTNAIAVMNSHIQASPKDMKALQAQGIDAWGALAREIGTSVPEAMEQVKKGLVSAQTVTEAVTKDMEQNFGGAAERSMTGWKGAMHILNETTEDAMVSIGRVIGDILTTAKPIIEGVTAVVKELSEWFTALPGPVKEVMLIFTGATGVMMAFGVGLGPVAIAIGAVVAALALLAKWAYDHWDSIKAVFTEGVDFLSKVFAPLINIWKAEWDVLVGIVTKAWDLIKSVFGAIADGISTFIKAIGGFASSIPGVGDEIKKLTTTWNEHEAALKKSKDAQDAANKATEAAAAKSAALRKESMAADAAELARANAAKASAEATKKAQEEEKKRQDEAKKAAAEYDAMYKKLDTSNEQLAASEKQLSNTFLKAQGDMAKAGIEMVDIVASNYDRLGGPDSPLSKAIHLHAEAEDAMKHLGVTSTQTYQTAITDAQDYAEAVKRAYGAGQASAQDYQAALDVVKQKQKDFKDYIDKDMTDAFHQFGLKTQGEMDEMQKKADEAYGKIVASAGANSVQAKEAWITKTQETYADILQQGGTLTQNQMTELERAKQLMQNHLDGLPSIWKGAYDGVHQVIGTFVDDSIKALVHGEGSLGDAVKNMLSGLGDAAIQAFVAPFKKALEDFMATTIADLLGGKGLGGISDSLGKLKSSVTDVFSGGAKGATGAAGDVSGVGGGISGAGGAAGGAGGAGGGLGGFLSGGLFGNILSAGTLVSSIVGNVQQAKMETTLNAIEESTRYSALYLGARGDGGILNVLFKIDEEIAWGANTKANESHRDLFKDWSNPALAYLNGIHDQLIGVAPYIVDTKVVLENIRDSVHNIEQGIQTGATGVTLNVTAGNLTTAEAARTLGDRIARNLTTQLAGA